MSCLLVTLHSFCSIGDLPDCLKNLITWTLQQLWWIAPLLALWSLAIAGKHEIIGSLTKDDVDDSKKVVWKCNVCNFWIISKLFKVIILAKCATETRRQNLSSSADVVYTTAKKVISRRRKNENGRQMYKYENALAKLPFFSIVKYANLWRSCCRCGYLSSATVATQRLCLWSMSITLRFRSPAIGRS